jgi:hypothetical protein
MATSPLPRGCYERMFVAMVSNWRDGFEYAWQLPDPEPDGPGLVWRETGATTGRARREASPAAQ